MTPERMARVCHEANRAYCAAHADFSQLPWDEAPAWQRDSAVLGVKKVLADPHVTPQQMHEYWFALKFKDGWRYGPEKNPEKKLHPCMLPYDRLPEEQRKKDELFSAVVRALM
jgi:hypothetical protein